MADGWANLGAALGGDSEKAYQEGLALGAKTEDALAAARERVEKNAAKARMETDLVATGVPRTRARAAATALTAGADLTDPIQLMLKQQEHDFRAQAGDPNVPLDTAQRAMLAVSSGPADDPLKKLGGGYYNIFETEKGLTPLGDLMTPDAGTSAQMQLLDRFGFPRTLADPAQKDLAIKTLRDTLSMGDAGGQPFVYDRSPYAGGPPAQPGAAPLPGAPAPMATPPVAPLVPTATVAQNAGAIASAKEQGQAQGKAASGLPDTLADIDRMRTNITGLLAQPGFNKIYGNLQGNPAVSAVQGVADMTNETANAKAALAQLDAQAFGVSIQKMVGLGQLSNAEGLKVTAAFTRATNPSISEDEARRAWAEVLATLDQSAVRAQVKAGAAPAVPGAAPDAGGWQTVNGVRIRVKPQ